MTQPPSGEVTFRAADHQSTMGTWVGRTALRDGKGVMVDWTYIDGADLLPPPAGAALSCSSHLDARHGGALLFYVVGD